MWYISTIWGNKCCEETWLLAVPPGWQMEGHLVSQLTCLQLNIVGCLTVRWFSNVRVCGWSSSNTRLVIVCLILIICCQGYLISDWFRPLLFVDFTESAAADGCSRWSSTGHCVSDSESSGLQSGHGSSCGSVLDEGVGRNNFGRCRWRDICAGVWSYLTLTRFTWVIKSIYILLMKFFNAYSPGFIVVLAPCGLRGCKNRPALFPGRMSDKATKLNQV